MGVTCRNCQPCERYSAKGLAGHQWKPLDSPGTQPQYSNEVVKCMLMNEIGTLRWKISSDFLKRESTII